MTHYPKEWQDADAAFKRIFELDPFGIPQIKEMAELGKRIDGMAIMEIERAFRIGFMEGKKSK